MSVAFKKRTGTVAVVVAALAGSNVTATLLDMTSILSSTQQFSVRVYWFAKDDGDTTKGAMGQRQAVLRESGGTLVINGQNSGDTANTIGAMVTPTFQVSGAVLQMLVTNDGGITGEIQMRVELDY